MYRYTLGSFVHTQLNHALPACELVYSCTEFHYIFMSSSTLELVNIVTIVILLPNGFLIFQLF